MNRLRRKLYTQNGTKQQTLGMDLGFSGRSYFSLYDLAIPYLPREFYPMGQHVLSFGVTVVAGWLSYPFDTLHRRIIIAAGARKPSLEYHSTFHALVQIVQNEGITALFQGSLTNI
ncbi:hypothetical protein BGX34_001375, partial [Mortierella sp. NVP85]